MSFSQPKASNGFEIWLFAFGVGVGSRLLVLRDRLLGHLRPVATGCRHKVPSGENILDASWVVPDDAWAALLICHGIGETPEHWPHAQQLLAEAGVASLIFNYSGFGCSTGRVSPKQCERDAEAAYAWLRERLPGVQVTLLGFSLGTGVATTVCSRMEVSGLILCEGYTSFREAAARLGVPPGCFHGVWRNVETLAGCPVPLLVVHGGRDRLFPVAMGQALAAAGGGKLAVIDGMGHSDLHSKARLEDWQVIVEWMRQTQSKR